MTSKPFALFYIFLLAACNNQAGQEQQHQAMVDAKGNMTRNGIRLQAVTEAAVSENASIEWLNKTAHIEGDSFTFIFSVRDFQLGMNTGDSMASRCANSDRGQHIHFILDNQPYVALYDTQYTTYLKAGEHSLLAFLSRSYHQSVKSPKAAVFAHFKSGNLKLMNKPFDMQKPMLFYSRPKGDYIGTKQIKEVLLDYYVLNTEISKQKHHVRATIDSAQVFHLYDWKPYLISGLGEGTHKIRLELLDAADQLVAGPNTLVEREFRLMKEEPLP